MNDKKIKEETIILEFQKESQLNFQILNTEEAKSKFKNYNGENPDFIILKDSNYIGVELFQLSLDRSRQLEGKFDEEGNQFINLPHRDSKIPNIINNIDEESQNYSECIKKYGLAPQDPIDDAIMQRISDKILKLDLYVTPKIWLLGYATEISYQTGMIGNIFKDGIDDIKKFIFEGIDIPDKVEKIFLFETGTSSKNYLVTIK